MVGFNAGSALTSGGLAASAFVATNTAAAMSALTWMFLSWFYHRPTVSGMATGAVAGLVAITPAAGFCQSYHGYSLGIGVAVICFFMMRLRNKNPELTNPWMFSPATVWAAPGALSRPVSSPALL